MMIKCLRCNTQHLLLEMVMDSSGKGMVCRQCAGLPPKREVATAQKSYGKESLAGSSKGPSTIRDQFAKPKSPQKSSGKFACLNCRYRFSSSQGPDMISCPYCGSKRISSPEENSADAILRDAGKRDYDF